MGEPGGRTHSPSTFQTATVLQASGTEQVSLPSPAWKLGSEGQAVSTLGWHLVTALHARAWVWRWSL